jgi:hypothetical protein
MATTTSLGYLNGADVQATWLETRVHQLLRQLARDVDCTCDIVQTITEIFKQTDISCYATPAVTTIRIDRPSTGSPKGVVTLTGANKTRSTSALRNIKIPCRRTTAATG